MDKQEKEELVNQLNGRLINYPSDSWDKGYNEGIKTAVIVVRNMHTVDEPQKVKVPEFVSREIVYYRAKGFSNSQIIEDAYNSNVPNQFTKWYWTGSNKDLFFDAVAYGCIVEKV